MYTFTLLSDGNNHPLFGAYLASLTGINDDFWEEHVLGGVKYAIEMDGKTIGMLGIHGGENLSLFHVNAPYIRHAQPAFAAALERLQPRYAYVATNDEAFLSLCMDNHKSIDMQAYFFRQGEGDVRPPEFERGLLRLATPEDASDILDTEGVDENIRLGRYFAMRKDGVFLGQGFFNRNTVIPNVASIGMSVHPDHRQKGVGRSIIMHLSAMCREQGITPVCGCWYYNHNSKRTLESAGFTTHTRLLKVWFTDKGDGD